MDTVLTWLLAVDLAPTGTVQPAAVNAYFQLVILSVGLVALITTVWWRADIASNEEVSEGVTITRFDRLEISGALNVLVTAGVEPSLITRGPKQVINGLRIRQYGNTLKISQRFRFWHCSRDLLLTLTTPDMRSAEISGANLVQFKEFKNLDMFDLEVTGASNVTFEGEPASINAELTGASRLTMIGHSNHLTAELTGASSLHAFDFPVEHATIELTGACQAHLYVHQQLAAEATGASRIQYRGEPIIRIQSAGASSINRV
ncbi:GIN domain-containing protein [Tellurirhabdus bombi]|uniref:GIN domain-containing protein n=1 Tax=Tellurirhabdus bombi TaxID=2907205 RepID=UPI001F38B491|nr:DUF2807 domain-containing protein [Tellurirhabdus bombi]